MEEKTLIAQTYEDPDSGLTHYLVIDPDDLDPNGEPVIFEVTATEYIEVLGNQN